MPARWVPWPVKRKAVLPVRAMPWTRPACGSPGGQGLRAAEQLVAVGCRRTTARCSKRGAAVASE